MFGAEVGIAHGGLPDTSVAAVVRDDGEDEQYDEVDGN